MTNPPAFQIYVKDFDMDTATWENHEIGAYLRLLFYEWENGGLPDDTYKLAKIVRESERKFKKTWKNLSQKFTLNGKGLLINKRLEEVRQNQINYSESRRKNVLSRYQPKPTYVPTYEEHMSLHSPYSSSSSSKDNNNKEISTIVENPKKPNYLRDAQPLNYYRDERQNYVCTRCLKMWMKWENYKTHKCEVTE